MEKIEIKKRTGIVLLIGVMIFCFFTMYYADITVTSRFGVIFLDSIFDGKLFSFYENALNSGIAPEGAVYDIGMYVIFGVWSIPVWLISKVCSIDQMSVGCLLWYKLLVALFVGLCAFEFYKLALKIMTDKKTAQVGCALFLSSIMVFFPTFVVSQYDVIGLFFMMLGVNEFLNSNHKKFVCAFAIAILMKPFPIFPFVLLLVIEQKNILKILINFMSGVLPFIGGKILYSLTEGYNNSAGNFVEKNMEALLSNSISTNGGEISLFFLVLILLYGVAYCINKDCTQNKYKEYVLIMLSLLWGDFMIFVNTAPYWIIYFEPFFLLVALIGKEVNNKLIFEFIANISILISMIFKYPWVYGGDKMYSYLLLRKATISFLENGNGITVAGALRKLSLENYLPVIDSIFVASVVIVLAIEIKGFRLDKAIDLPKECITHWQLYLRIAVLYLWELITIGLLLLSIRLRG